MNYWSPSKILLTEVSHSEFWYGSLFLVRKASTQSDSTNPYGFSHLPRAESCWSVLYSPAKLPLTKLQDLEAQSSPQAAQVPALPPTLPFWEASGLGERWTENKGPPKVIRRLVDLAKKTPKPLHDMTAFGVLGSFERTQPFAWHLH